jgi:hypothetical protein
MKKIISIYIMVNVLSFLFLTAGYAKFEIEEARTSQLTGTVSSFSDKHIIVANKINEEVTHTHTFTINEKTMIKGSLRKGAMVTVTYTAMRIDRKIVLKTALVIQVIEEPPEKNNTNL